MRLFIAIKPDEKMLDALTDFQDDLLSMGAGGNFSKRENLHVTLAFIGEYKDPYEVLDVIEQTDFQPLEIKLDGVGHFGDLFHAKVVLSPELEAYAKRLRRALAENNIPYDRKRFRPHITLIRKAYFPEDPEIRMPEPPQGTMTAKRVSLMKSERGKSGVVYTEIEP